MAGSRHLMSRLVYKAAMNDNTCTMTCPCGSNKEYAQCCQPYVEQTITAPTAEALMRSRYTAFVLRKTDYLRYSWHPDTCPDDIQLDPKTRWLGLKIINIIAGGVSDSTGEVEFVARSKIDGRASRLHEISRFTREHGRWLYVDGDLVSK